MRFKTNERFFWTFFSLILCQMVQETIPENFMELALFNPKKNPLACLQTPWNAFPGKSKKSLKIVISFDVIPFLTYFFHPFNTTSTTFHNLCKKCSHIIKNVQNSWILSLFVLRETDQNQVFCLRKSFLDSYRPNFG